MSSDVGDVEGDVDFGYLCAGSRQMITVATREPTRGVIAGVLG